MDKEALAAVAGVKRFHEYLYGRAFELVTDHKPLLGIITGDCPTLTTMSPRMNRWTIFLAAYNYRFIHQPSKAHTDGLSHCPLPELIEDPTPMSPFLLIDVCAAKPVTAAKLVGHTTKDKTLSKVLNWVLMGWPHG